MGWKVFCRTVPGSNQPELGKEESTQAAADCEGLELYPGEEVPWRAQTAAAVGDR